MAWYLLSLIAVVAGYSNAQCVCAPLQTCACTPSVQFVPGCTTLILITSGGCGPSILPAASPPALPVNLAAAPATTSENAEPAVDTSLAAIPPSSASEENLIVEPVETADEDEIAVTSDEEYRRRMHAKAAARHRMLAKSKAKARARYVMRARARAMAKAKARARARSMAKAFARRSKAAKRTQKKTQ
ncbi:hypothetical protein AB6A40_006334 [Gnathostoma spinigerum]|uniref:Uncharacterized protein n=1 Tax=Gnathostoma spinigerum TaxID=75299 RepID=A0ABD6EI30_9BILA